MEPTTKEEKPKTEHEKFVDNMLKSADETKQAKPHTPSVSHEEVEQATKEIMDRLQKKKK